MHLSLICIFLMSFVITRGENKELRCRFVMQSLFSQNISETSRCGDLGRIKSLLQLFKTSANFGVDRYIKDCTSPIILRSNVTRRLSKDQGMSISINVTEEDVIIECLAHFANECQRLFYHLRETKLDFPTITHFPSIMFPNLSNITSAYAAGCGVTNREQFTDLSDKIILGNISVNGTAEIVQYLHTGEPIISLKIHHSRIYVHSFNTPLKTLTRRLFVILNHNTSTLLYYDILNNLTALEVFDISGNGLFSVPEDLLLFNSQLITCDLSYNKLREIPPSFFRHTTSLINLRLDRNQLQILSPDLFINNKDLNILLLNHNQLSHLPSTLFVNNFKMSKLNLESNNLVDLPRTLFPRNISLQQLNLSQNQLKSLNLTLLDDPAERRIGDLSKSAYLREMLILRTENYSKDAEVNLNTLLKTNELITFNASHNRLRNLPKDLFKQSQILRFFDGSYNPEVLKFTNSHFLYSLEIITFTDCNIEYIEATANSIFSYISLINLLEFSRNKIKGIDGTTFRNCRYLEVIFLSDNLLTHLEPGLFKDLETLYYLNLSGNMLSTLPYQLFSVQSLLHLNVSRNHIQNFGPTPLVTVLQSVTSHVQALDLSNNCLTSSEIAPLNVNRETPLYLIYINIEFNALVNIPRIPTGQTGYYIHLGHNAIRNIEVSNLEIRTNNEIESVTDRDGLLMKKPGSVLISLCPNPLKRICRFQNMSCEMITQEYLHHLHKVLPHVDIKNCYVSHETGENYTSRSLRKVKFGCPFTPTCSKRYYQSIFCSGNVSCDLQSQLVCQITESCPSLCQCYKVGFEQITVVNCSKSNLTTLPLFIPPKTKVLRFEHNKLRNLSQFNNSIWSSLIELYLDNNEISSAHLSHLPLTIKKLSMKHNRIQTLNINRVENFTHLQMWLGGNPWLCDCSALALKTLIQTSKIIIDGKDILCTSSNRSLVETDAEEICAEKLKLTTNISLAVAFGVLLPIFVASIAVLYYNNKQTIIAYIYTHHPRIFECFCTPTEFEEQKTFDAFISYSGSDTYVVKQFIEQLEEKEPHISLCVHERDWLPGDDISTNIANSVCMSRKTVIILSKEFLKSIWFSVELHSAYYQSVEDKVDRLILVLKGDLPDLHTLDEDLQVLLKTKTYLVWGERWFWEKLRYALSHNKM